MKPILMIIIPLVVFLGISGITMTIVNKDARELSRNLEKVQKAVENENWVKASEDLKPIIKEWETTKKKWKALIDHIEVDRIETSLVRSEELITQRSKKDCMAEIAVLKQIILHIPEKEKLTLSNIF